VVRGWVAIYTLGLPAVMRIRRRDEVAADLAEEELHAIRRGDRSGLFPQRLIRLLAGMPADVAWRLIDAPAMARDLRIPMAWVPLTRWTLVPLAVISIGAAGALTVVAVPLVTGAADPATWQGWGPVGFAVGCIGVLISTVVAVPWPRRAAMIVAGAVIVGLLASPWLWGCWSLAALAIAARVHQAGQGTTALVDRSEGGRTG
jgi:hypothetical protein